MWYKYMLLIIIVNDDKLMFLYKTSSIKFSFAVKKSKIKFRFRLVEIGFEG